MKKTWTEKQIDKDQFLEWKKDNFPAICFVEQITNQIADEMVNAPTDCAHNFNYFWKEIVLFCLEQIE